MRLIVGLWTAAAVLSFCFGVFIALAALRTPDLAALADGSFVFSLVCGLAALVGELGCQIEAFLNKREGEG